MKPPATSNRLRHLVTSCGLGLALLAASLVACTTQAEATLDEDLAAYPRKPIDAAAHWGFDPSRINDERARRGLANIYAGKGFHAGLPAQSKQTAERLARAAALAQTQPERAESTSKQGQYVAFGRLPSPITRSQSDLPLGTSVFEREGVTLANTNCFACHAGVVDGRIVAGLGNHAIDQVAIRAEVESLVRVESALMADALLRPSTATRERAELTDFYVNARGTILPTYKFARARGDNMGPFAVWMRLARLADPSRTGLRDLPLEQRTERDELFDSVTLVPVDPNPWWTRKYKRSNYSWGETSPHAATHFAFNFTTPHERVNENHDAHVQAIADVLAFAEQTSSPPFPEPLDPNAVQRGRRLFHGEDTLAAGGKLGCANCHGSYTKGSQFERAGGWTVRYSSRGVLDVGTDPAYSELVLKLAPLADHGNQLADFFARSGRPELAPQVRIPARRGYLAPVLVGIWASAPYFHNGSVPTLDGVLSSALRPRVWAPATDNAFAYNRRRVGLAYRAVELSRESYLARERELSNYDVLSPERVAFRALYQTELPGRSNAGHTFGDALSASERADVVEFLKSLSGEDMPPAAP